MAIRFFRPADVSPSRVRAVLDFLNAAESAEEVALATDIPGVHDIGIRLAERILERRDQLGGFTDIAQVFDVPLIGPVRFTRLVKSLTGPRRRRPTSGPAPDVLARELRELRARVDALLSGSGTHRRVTLRVLQPRPFLGEAVDLVAHVAGPDGRPLVNAPLTLVTTWGQLTARDGARRRDGSSVTTRTDANGRARAILLPMLSERLSPGQASSLAVALSRLDREAPTPREAADSLRALGRSYRMPAGAHLRRAMDVYFRDFGIPLFEPINPRDFLNVWDLVPSTVFAYVRDGVGATGHTSVQATAALTLQMMNWVGPWLELMHESTREDSRLGTDLVLSTRLQEPGPILGTVYKRLRDFVTDQPGLAGEFVARRVADTTLADFTRDGIVELPAAVQDAIAPALAQASQTVRASGSTVVGTARQTRVEMDREANTVFDRKIGDVIPPVVAELDTLRDGLNAKLDASTFSSFEVQMQSELESRVAIDTFAAFQTQISNLFDGVVDFDTFTQLEQQISSQLAGKANVSTVQQLSSTVASLESTTIHFNDTISTLDSSLTLLDNELRNLKEGR